MNNDNPHQPKRHTGNPARLVAVLFSVQLTIIAILAASTSSLKAMEAGAIIFVLPLLAAHFRHSAAIHHGAAQQTVHFQNDKNHRMGSPVLQHTGRRSAY